ncbi:MAG: type I-C CRISPR-associated protein Cas7/Csd2 [Candidatus Accumulibacter sp.]|jgi:CRISPR-associated protein Csd2|nr:type I-C CRISPR-associated protein Cas7/Csd2 [Accumulibacter sp.]
MSDSIKSRYDFVLVFDVKDGNPNGDPDAGNLPRVDAETGQGLVTDVCLKRKIRNFVQLTQTGAGYDMFIKEKAILNNLIADTYKELNVATGQESRKDIPSDFVEEFREAEFCNGLSISEEDDETVALVVAEDADKPEIKKWIKESALSKGAEKFIDAVLKDAKSRKTTPQERDKGKAKMCEKYYDIRTFGAVMSTGANAGQVRGPVQLTFARSIDPIVTLEHSITRMAVTTEADAVKQSGDNRTMGRKNTVPYGVYVAYGFISPALANLTGFLQNDLDLLWKALKEMFEHDRSAARGLMATQKLIVFKHDSALGNAPAHELFKRVKVEKKKDVEIARDFDDYEFSINKNTLPEGITVEEKL